MRAHEVITELFDTSAIEWSDRTHATFEVNGERFNVSFKQDGGGGSYYEFAFTHGDGKDATFHNTGKIGAASTKVFGNALSCVAHFLNQRRPYMLGFYGFAADGRDKLYGRMVQTLAPKIATLGYDVEQKPMKSREHGPGIEFNLVRRADAPPAEQKPAPITLDAEPAPPPKWTDEDEELLRILREV